MTRQERLWAEGPALLSKQGAIPERQARSVIGKWLKTYSAEVVLETIQAAVEKQIIEPVGWITRSLELRAQRSPRASGSPPVVKLPAPPSDEERQRTLARIAATKSEWQSWKEPRQ